MGDKYKLTTVLNWIENSIIVSHEALSHMNIINNELKARKYQEIPKETFRCSMGIFKMIIEKVEPLNYRINISLKKCCEYFNLSTDDYTFYKTSWNSFYIALIMSKLYN